MCVCLINERKSSAREREESGRLRVPVKSSAEDRKRIFEFFTNVTREVTPAVTSCVNRPTRNCGPDT